MIRIVQEVFQERGPNWVVFETVDGYVDVIHIRNNPGVGYLRCRVLEVLDRKDGRIRLVCPDGQITLAEGITLREVRDDPETFFTLEAL